MTSSAITWGPARHPLLPGPGATPAASRWRLVVFAVLAQAQLRRRQVVVDDRLADPDQRQTAIRNAVGHVSGGPREVCSHAVRSNTARALLSMLNSVMSAELWTGESHGQATGRSAVQPPQVRGKANGRWRQRNACRTRPTPSARPGRLQVPKAALAQWLARWQPVPTSTSTGELSMQRSSMLGWPRTARSSTCLALSMSGLLACTAPTSPRILVEAPSPAGPRQNARLCSAPRYPPTRSGQTWRGRRGSCWMSRKTAEC